MCSLVCHLKGFRLDKESETVTCEISQVVKPKADFSEELSNSISAFHSRMWVSEITHPLALVPSA